MDQLPLVEADRTWRCSKGHAYDTAKEGYLNLLLVQQKGSLAPGDDKAMVAARARFLARGFFEPVAAKVFDLVLKMNPRTIVDAGCGEGYYLEALSNRLKESVPQVALAGFDISKEAVRAAAKRKVPIAWAVASNRRIPFQPPIDLLLSMFGFPIWESFRAMQPEGGAVLLVDPGEDHLLELRELIYPEVKKNPPPALTDAVKAGYILESEERLRFSVNLPDPQAIQDLLMMTPHGHRISKEAEERLARIKQITVNADIVFRVCASRENSL